MANGTCSCKFALHNYLVVLSVGMSCRCCVGLITIATIWRTLALHNTCNYFIVSTAACDMLFNLIFIHSALFYFIRYDAYETNAKAFYCFVLGVSYSSVFSLGFHLAVTAVNRYIYTLKPFYYIKHMNGNYKVKMLIIIWVLIITYAIIPVLFYRGEQFHTKCIIIHPPIAYYETAVIINSSFCIIICTCYIQIARAAFERKKAIRNRKQQNCMPNDVIINITNRKAAIKSIKYVAAMSGGILLCYIPSGVSTQLSQLSYSVPESILLCSFYVSQVAPIINFLVYINMNAHFRLGIKQLFSKCLLTCCQ